MGFLLSGRTGGFEVLFGGKLHFIGLTVVRKVDYSFM